MAADRNITRTHLTTQFFDKELNVVLDCNLFESHVYASEVTESPIEDGSSIVDHVLDRPVELKIEAIFSGFAASNDAPDGFGTDARERFSLLNLVRSQASLVTVTTPFESYNNMVITNITATNTPEVNVSHGTIRFSMSMKQVTLVKSRQITVTEKKYKKKKKTRPKLPTVSIEELIKLPGEYLSDMADRYKRGGVAKKNKVILDKLGPGETLGGAEVPGSGANFLP